MLNKSLAGNTVRRACAVAKQSFTAAVRSKLSIDNPFADLASTVKVDTKHLYYVIGEYAQRVLEACPDTEWRLLFALARYGGLRVPSEALCLCWSNIDWGNNRFVVTSPKSEHFEGHESRRIPIFPELMRYPREAFEQNEPGSEFCITRYRNDKVILRPNFNGSSVVLALSPGRSHGRTFGVPAKPSWLTSSPRTSHRHRSVLVCPLKSSTASK